MALSEYIKAACRPKTILGIIILAGGPIFMLFNQAPGTELPVSSIVIVCIFFIILLMALWTDLDKAVKADRKARDSEGKAARNQTEK